MKRTLVMVVLLVTLLISGSAFAQGLFTKNRACVDNACVESTDCCDTTESCCNPPGFIGNVELTFMKYLQEGGVADADGTGINFDLQLAPRFEVGFMGQRGVGFRTRYWHYDADANAIDGDNLSVKTYNVDLELFHQRSLDRWTSLEFSLGMRYLDFMQDTEGNGGISLVNNEFEGWGATLAVEAKRRLGVGSVYLRGRWSVLLGNADINNYNGGVLAGHHYAHDTTSTQTELAVGYEITRNLGQWGTGALRAGGEWQMWDNVAIGDNSFGGIGNDDVLEDAGFAGVALRMELRR